MKQHPIDDLFNRRLNDHRIKPEKASWEALQRRMQKEEQRKNPFVWWYAAAASVALLLIATYVFEGSGEKVTRVAANKEAIKKAPSSEPLPVSSPDSEQTNAGQQPIAVAEERPIAGTNQPSRADDRQLPVHPASPTLAINENVQINIDEVEPIKAVEPIATGQQREKTLIVQIAEPAIISGETVATSEQRSTPISSNVDKPARKPFRFGRLIRQINNLKAGEPIEWEEVGMQPKEVVAKAAERIQEEKEKVINSYENIRNNAFNGHSNK